MGFRPAYWHEPWVRLCRRWLVWGEVRRGDVLERCRPFACLLCLFMEIGG